MDIAAETENELRIVSVRDNRIDAAVAIEFKDAMRREIDGGPGTIILDLGQVEFIDSSGLGAIVAALKHIGRDRCLALAELTPAVARVFELTRMDSVFRIFPNRSVAMAALRKS